ncbi:hypothetical protein HNQ08_004526 [Deinococcus humi]|uniref:Uncharacterized protein n=1 Tax=Deinococcus humi TaxID=662880 RepID=A0A7W8JY87_9DEIO|nr:hypothetical protein [Deinococcus humi]
MTPTTARVIYESLPSGRSRGRSHSEQRLGFLEVLLDDRAQLIGRRHDGHALLRGALTRQQERQQLASSDDSGLRNSSRSTPESRTFTSTPASLCLPKSNEAA